MSYGRTFQHWREAAGETWAGYVRHDFVRALGDGSLPRAAFLHYLVQDYIFLLHFSRAWALAMTKAETVAQMRTCAATAKALIDDELRLHVRTCAAAGIDEAALVEAEERAENLAYTRFVLDAGHSGDFMDLLAALAPCVLGYGEIGARLTAQAGGTPYAEWIGTYGGAEYQALCADVGALIDGAAERRLGPAPQGSPRWPQLCRTFTTATRLEIGFWDMGLRP
ncbi:MAG: TenA family protein [Sediminimonas qiaohouensis]|uniref:TenA family protein n=1 Tax=Sediminimonas qiaohouensis TaxID=552061 RepID=A0A7C9HN94_9RHOB|nr:TenA family protein [Sediminimonas qiaohouensis]MTJ04903.1 TenA family protein [Sediminimonas qiaohouensis]